MRSVTASLDFLTTLLHDGKAIACAVICSILSSVLISIYGFIKFKYSAEGSTRSLTIGGLLGIPQIISSYLFFFFLFSFFILFYFIFFEKPQRISSGSVKKKKKRICSCSVKKRKEKRISSGIIDLGPVSIPWRVATGPFWTEMYAKSSVRGHWPRVCISTSPMALAIATGHKLHPVDFIKKNRIKEGHWYLYDGSIYCYRAGIDLSVLFHLPQYIVRENVNRMLAGIDLSNLPPDIVREIVNRLPTYKDEIAAKGVSKCWQLTLSSTSRGTLPLLMLSEPLLTDMRTLFSLYDNSRHRLQLSEVHGKRIWGSQHGWVVTLGPRYVTQLVHRIKGKRINLPPLCTIRRQAPREEWFCLVHKFILLKDPSYESTFLVIAIFGPMNSLAFTRVRLGAALNRRGEGEWVVVANPENLKFKDVVNFNGQIYALCDNGKLVCFEPVAPFANMVQVIADHPQDVGAHLKIYLVQSLGNLYAVFRNGFLIPSERTHETTSFFVYKFNINASAWEEVTRLEGQAFFVGDSNSFSRRFPTSILPSISDCIYFTDDHWVWRKFPRKAYGGHDVGLFNMEIRKILPLTFGKDKPRFYSRPIFVTCNDRL